MTQLVANGSISGTISTVDAATGNITTQTITGTIGATGNLTESEGEIDITTPNQPESDTTTHTENGQESATWNITVTTTITDANGNPIGSPTTKTDSGTDAVTDNSGTLTNSYNDLVTTGANPPTFSGPTSFTVPIGDTPTGLGVTASGNSGNDLLHVFRTVERLILEGSRRVSRCRNSRLGR